MTEQIRECHCDEPSNAYMFLLAWDCCSSGLLGQQSSPFQGSVPAGVRSPQARALTLDSTIQRLQVPVGNWGELGPS
jgi:hypothetical protein